MEIQFIGQGCSKRLCYKWLHSEIVLSHRKMKQQMKQQQLYPSDIFSTRSLEDMVVLWIYALPDRQLNMGISHPHQGSGVSVRPPLTALEWETSRSPSLMQMLCNPEQTEHILSQS